MIVDGSWIAGISYMACSRCVGLERTGNIHTYIASSAGVNVGVDGFKIFSVNLAGTAHVNGKPCGLAGNTDFGRTTRTDGKRVVLDARNVYCADARGIDLLNIR